MDVKEIVDWTPVDAKAKECVEVAKKNLLFSSKKNVCFVFYHGSL